MPPKRARERKRQSKLNFSSAAKSSPAAKPSAATMGQSNSTPAHATPTRAVPKVKPRSSRRVATLSLSDDELQAETERGLRLGIAAKHTPQGMFDGSDVGLASSQSEDEEEEEPVKPKPATRKRRHAKDDMDSEDDEGVKVTVEPRRRRRQRKEVEVQSSDDELNMPKKRRKTRKESSPEEAPTPPRSARRRAPRQPSTSEDEEEVQTPSRSARRKATKRRSPSVEETGEESLPRTSRHRATRGESVLDEEDLDEVEDVDGSGDDKDDGEEREELQEDLAWLRSSPLPDRGRLRSTQGKPKNERQKALEALKARRAGTNEPSSSMTPGRKRTVVVESEPESASELEVIEEESEVETPEEMENEEEDDRDANALDMFQESEEDAEFIDDDDALIGEPSVHEDLQELRIVNSLKRAKTKDLFKHAVEWMVMKKIHPAFNSTKNIYTVTFRKLDDEVKGLAGSKFTSSVWTPEFTRTIRARPNVMIDELSSKMRDILAPHCEACNRTNHTATFELMFMGPPYDAETLEPLETGDSDSESSSDRSSSGEKPVYDSTGAELPPEDRRFLLGSTCKANAQVAHTLYHWRYNLYDWVKDYLAREGHLTAEKLVKRDKWSDKKRAKAALKIVDAMADGGEVKKLYRLYKEQVEFALEAKNEYRNGWGRRG